MSPSIKEASYALVKEEIQITIAEARSDGPAEVYGRPSPFSQSILLGAHKALLELAKDIEKQLANCPDLKSELDSHVI